MDKLLINQGSIELEVHYDAVIEKCTLDIYHRYFPSAHFYLDKSEITQLRDYLNQILGDEND